MNVRVNLNYTIYDGAEIVFKAPCDASEVTGLIVYYPVGTEEVSSVFAFGDAHTNDLGNIDDLFAKGAVVKVIIDTETSMAFVQNAATNAYLENRFAGIGGGGGANVMIVSCQDGEHSNYLPSQIFAHVQAGGIAMLHLGSMCINLSWVSEYFAMFSEYNDDYCHYANIIYKDGRYERLEMFHAQGDEIWNYCEELSNAIGHLPEALDRIIEIQEELIGV